MMSRVMRHLGLRNRGVEAWMWLAHTLPFLSTLVDFILTYLKLALHMAIKPGLQYSKVLHPVPSVPGKSNFNPLEHKCSKKGPEGE